MSPSAALASEVFRIFALLTTGLLAAGGLTIAVLRYGFAKNVTHAWDSYLGWLIMIPAISASLFAGRSSRLSRLWHLPNTLVRPVFIETSR
jgi:hypothetical protein